jgi:hypothetical protein
MKEFKLEVVKKIGITILALGLLSSCYNNQKPLDHQTQTKYYTKLAGIISPYMEYLGRGEISKLEADTLRHYRFVYNEKAEVLKIQYFDKDEPNDNSYFGTHEVKYSYEEDKLIRSYYNSSGGKSSTYRHYYFGGDIHKEIFKLDENKDKISLILNDSLNNQVESGLGSYLFKFQKVSNDTFIQKQFKKDGSPNVLTSYFPFSNTKISIKRDGFLFSISNVNEEGNVIMNDDSGYAYVVFDFDEYGNELGWSFLDEHDNLSNRQDYLGQDYGFAKVVYKFSWLNRELGIHNGFEEAYFDRNHLPVENNTRTHLIRYEYDHNGNFLGMTRFDKEGVEVRLIQ